jgi:hypothetical protein
VLEFTGKFPSPEENIAYIKGELLEGGMYTVTI